jgi:nucleoside diphosphate kinase
MPCARGRTYNRPAQTHCTKPVQAEEFYAEQSERAFFPKLVDFMSSGHVVALALAGRGAVATWRRLCGPTSTETAKVEAPESLRAKFGTHATRNAVHGSDSPASAAHEIEMVFGRAGVELKAPESQGFRLGTLAARD